MSQLDSIVIETREQPDAAIIWLHGLGADGNDFVPIIDQIRDRTQTDLYLSKIIREISFYLYIGELLV